VPQQEQAAAERDGRAEDERWHLRKDGTRFWASGVMSPLYDAETGALRGFGKVLRDLTERKRHEETLERRVEERTAELSGALGALEAAMAECRQAEAERRELTRRLSEAQEAERKRISRELHDQMGQQLTGLALGLRALEAGLPPEAREASRERIGRLNELAQAISRQMHDAALELRPPSLDEVGLPSTLRAYVEHWAERFVQAAGPDASVDFDSDGWGDPKQRLPPEIETAIYRVVQEALTNVLRHAGASRVGVAVSRRDGQARATVEDDGAGFDPEAAGQGRLGLVGMRERAALVGGTVEIESTPGRGATVFLRVPIPT
jgi:signal transduction histidine kinase